MNRQLKAVIAVTRKIVSSVLFCNPYFPVVSNILISEAFLSFEVTLKFIQNIE